MKYLSLLVPLMLIASGCNQHEKTGTPSYTPPIVGYQVFGNGQISFTGTGTTTSNLSSSPGTCTLTGSGSVLGTAASGSYTYASSTALTNGNPAYSGTNGLDVWSTNLGTWVITQSGSLGTSTSSSLSGGTGPLSGQNFATTSGSAVANATAATSGWVSSGVSVPCSLLTLCCTTSGALVSSSTTAGTVPLPANVPLNIPASNVNQVFITGGSANTIGYEYFR